MKLHCAVKATSLWIIGVAIIIGAPPSCKAQSFTTLHSFDLTDGQAPAAALLQGTDGNFYGTTEAGGANSQGTIFKITPSGTLTTLYSFCAQSGCLDGEGPIHAALVQATDGNFYGTTPTGGANHDGTVFKITPSGTLTTLYSFCSQTNCTDGAYPNGIIQATDGNFYGTTGGLGANGEGGTVFKIIPSGTLTTLYSFCSKRNAFIGCTDGGGPEAALVQGTDGNFYGTTSGGGTILGSTGTVFKITPSGTLTTLYSFCSQTNCTDGSTPAAALVQGSDGNFYGTTGVGGAGANTATGAGGYGTVFKITPSSTLTTLYSFCSRANCTDGEYPQQGAALVQATDGDFYGTAGGGGVNGAAAGTIFKITSSGTLTTLYSFCSQSRCTDGSDPIAGLIQATNGDFYGITYDNGLSLYGTVFSLAALPPTFFANQDYLSANVYYMAFTNGSLFGYYEFLQGSGTTPAAWLYHFDLGYEYVTPGGAAGSLYFYDLESGHWWYSSSSLFPYLYDFTLNTWIYYFPNTQSAGHYSTNPRYFSNLTTGMIITM